MITKPKMWMTYIASCEWIYILIIISNLFYSYEKLDSGEITQKLAICWSQNKCVYILLLILIAFSIIENICWRASKNNTRITKSLEGKKDPSLDIAIAAYLVPIITAPLDLYGMIAGLGTIILLGFIIVQSENLYMCPYFVLHGYHAYTSDNVIILTKLTQEQYRLALDDSPNGIEAREITTNVYIVL